MNNVFEYLDYRKLLYDRYKELKEEKSAFSYRYIGKRVGFTSAGYFTKVLNGQTNISNEKILKLANVFKFNTLETEYFHILVMFNQAKTHNDKEHFLTRLKIFRKSGAKILKADQSDFFKHWYYVAIHGLLDYYIFRNDYTKLAKALSPKIKVSEAKDAIKTLLSLGLIKKDKDGVYKRVNNSISTGDMHSMVAVKSFQKQAIELSLDIFDTVPTADRDVSSLTVSISKESLDSIKNTLSECRKKIQEMAIADSKANNVYQINFQLFPFTVTKKGN